MSTVQHRTFTEEVFLETPLRRGRPTSVIVISK